MEFVRLFEPITINKVEVPNRIVMPSMGLWYTDNYDFNDRLKAFYRARAHGGVGLMTVGPVAIDRVGSAPFMPGLFDDRNLESLTEFVAEIHRDTETKLATQLFQMGRYAFSLLSGETPIAPSPIPSKLTRETPREMTLEDIEMVQDSFVQAAVRAKAVGFDLIEILGCTGYLVSQFLSPVTNHRTDDYGGTPEKRMRFGLETIRKVRAAVGPDVALGIRIAGHDFMDGGNTNKEAAEFAAAAEEAGLDAINVTGGWHETNIPQLTTNVPPGVYVYLARGIKARVNIPVFASNRLGDPVLAEKALRSGACDMVCWGRPLIADPDLPIKTKEKRLDEAVYCIACNQGCFDSIFSGTAVHCVLNPRAGREEELVAAKAETPKKVMVAGGGPAGMQFALTAAERGHQVTLYEKSASLGGQVNLAKVPPGKKELENVTSSLSKRMARAGVQVVINRAVGADLVKAEKPDVLAVATGAAPLKINVPGVDGPNVVDAWDVLSEQVPYIGQKVVVVGGSATGCETAHAIASMDAPDPEAFTFLMYHNAEDASFACGLLHDSCRQVTIIDVLDRLAGNVGRTARWSLMKSLRLEGVDLRPATCLKEITSEGVVVETGDLTETIPADTVVMAVGAKSLRDLAEVTDLGGVQVITLGDAKEPRNMTSAIREGYEEALRI